MGGLLSELGKKLAERWLSLLVLPGALYLAVAAAAYTLGHAHAFDISRLTDQITTWRAAPAARAVGGQVVVLAAVLAASAGIGLTAQVLGALTERLCLASDWPTWPPVLRHVAHSLVDRRQRRWDSAARQWHQLRESARRALASGGPRTDPAPRRIARRAMQRIAAEHPARPIWSGDRIQAAAERLERDQHIDLAIIWPHLQLILPDSAHGQITTARQDLTRATALHAWATLYLALTVWWWPALLITATLTLTGRARTRQAADTYALLLEAATRVHAIDLARQVGLETSGPLTPETGDALTRLLKPSEPECPPSTNTE